MYNSSISRTKLCLGAAHISINQLVLATTLSLCLHASAHADEGVISEPNNCFGGECIGPIFLYDTGPNDALEEIVSEVACRIRGLNIEPISLEELSQGAHLEASSSVILMVGGLLGHGEIHPDFEVSPESLESATHVEKTITAFNGDDLFRHEILIVDRDETGCDSAACVLSVTLQFLEYVHELSFEEIADSSARERICFTPTSE